MATNNELNKAKIMFLAPLLPKPSEEAIEYVRNPFSFAIAFKKAGKRAEAQNLYWCGHCGQAFKTEELADYRPNPKSTRPWSGRKHLGTCPHCGMPMQIEDWPTKRKHYVDIIALPATFGSWKVDRYYEVDTWYKSGSTETNACRLIGYTWKKDGATYHYFAKQGGMFYSKYWKLDEPFHFVKDLPSMSAPTYWKGKDRYSIPKTFNFRKELRMRGLNNMEFHGLPLSQILALMNEFPYFETLWKQGNWEIAKFFKRDLRYYSAQIKIALRQHYEITDLNEWRDMVDMLRTLNKDDHSPKYLCPANLHEAHNTLLEQVERKRRMERERWERNMDELRRIESERKYKDAKHFEEEYHKRRSPYFGISIPSPNGFTIVVLQSIKEFKHEGDMLHHCVFHSAYYNRENSLILSARDSENNPIETIEVDLDDFRIKQCYGDHDTHTPLHNEICKTMRANMWQVKEITKGLRMAS